MMIVLALVGAGLYLGRAQIAAIFFANIYLNGVIFAVFVLGVLSCFGQVYQLVNSVQWIEGFARDHEGNPARRVAPSLLAPLATLLRSRGARMQLSSSSGRSILDSVGQRIDEDREITRYIGNTLIFLGLLGTFYGLATTVPALVETIRSLNPGEGEDGADIFGRLQAGLESQLGGMGTAFSSSLLGLAGSLVVGLLELFASHGQNRFYRELEEWLSTITRVGFSTGEDGGGDTSMLASFVDHLAEQMDSMQTLFVRSEESRAHVDERITQLVHTVETMAHSADQSGGDRDVLLRIAEGQEALIKKIGDGGMEGIDAESRMRLRSIDVQLLRILEEMSAGRQETIADLRNDIAGLARAIKQGRGRPPSDGA
ncbi:biopolymer transporter ExbB [Yoonia sp. 208BN28-4]|uniref:biopolymer transporter ExbB n=1 Tax=Yoonia sp. 208BN28-4 TaxID=3126505 RepID=UPI0030AF5C92